MCLVIGVGSASGAQPASRPASGPGVASDAGKPRQIARWLAALADADAAAREVAREELMALRREDLALLRAAAADVRPLAPSQAAVLREIVVQAYLSGEAYDKAERGFLGITLSAQRAPGSEMSVVVESRMIGFCGYRCLRDGDVVIDVEEFRLPRPMRPEEFIEAVQDAKPGRAVHLKVLRQGQTRIVPVKLDARPAQKPMEGATDFQLRVEAWAAGRQEKAEAYWKEHFAPLAEAGVQDP